MNNSEIPCNDCNFSFSDKITFNIHLKSCKDNINYDPKNKYYTILKNAVEIVKDSDEYRRVIRKYLPSY